jgi:hypothetical protein
MTTIDIIGVCFLGRKAGKQGNKKTVLTYQTSNRAEDITIMSEDSDAELTERKTIQS